MPALVLGAGYLCVVLLPLGLAWVTGGPPRTILDELASGAGMLAFAIILVEFVMSGRFRTISGRIGMDVTMRVHQLLARTALVLALIHPFLYQTGFTEPRPWDPTRQLSLTSDLESLLTGILAWVLLPTFVMLAIFRDRLDYSYETWRLMHGLGALLIAGLALHHTLHAGRYSQEPLAAGLWIALAAVAAFSLVYVYVLKPLMRARRRWRVKAVEPLAVRTWELTLTPDGHAGLDYRAGQFVWLNVGHSPFSIAENPFSISSCPSDGPDLRFIIKELGDFTNTLGSIDPGTHAYVDGPHGNLIATGHSESGIALIAGGVGIAPLMGILRQLHREGDPRPTALIYGNRIESQIVHGDELEQLARDHGTKVVHVLSEPGPDWQGERGLVDADVIERALGATDARTWLFILCGPPAMIESVEDTLIAAGVPPAQILSERFKYD